MIKKIDKKINDDILEVTVYTKVKDFAVHPTKILEEQYLKRILRKEYNILETIDRPSHLVGNSIRNNIKQIGTWTFRLEVEKQEVKTPVKEQPKKESPPKQEKTKEPEKAPTANASRPRGRRRPSAAKKTSTSSSVRDKMKNITNK
jgi:hypothetical protein|tara:strand:- start:3857 stop:4294 length:438 start_codon:yes stop_codon:yes gene_type:complete